MFEQGNIGLIFQLVKQVNGGYYPEAHANFTLEQFSSKHSLSWYVLGSSDFAYKQLGSHKVKAKPNPGVWGNPFNFPAVWRSSQQQPLVCSVTNRVPENISNNSRTTWFWNHMLGLYRRWNVVLQHNKVWIKRNDLKGKKIVPQMTVSISKRLNRNRQTYIPKVLDQMWSAYICDK